MRTQQLEATLEEVYPAIGRLAVAFSILEQSLEECAVAISRDYPTAREIEKRLPRTFSARVVFLKKCFAKIQELSRLADDADLIFQQTAELADNRNFLIHGALGGRPINSAGQLNLRKMTYTNGKPSFEERTYTVREIKDLGARCDTAALNALVLAWQVKHPKKKALPNRN